MLASMKEVGSPYVMQLKDYDFLILYVDKRDFILDTILRMLHQMIMNFILW